VTADRVIVGFDYSSAHGGDCAVLELLRGDPDERFLIPMEQVRKVAEALTALADEADQQVVPLPGSDRQGGGS
jgi:hypothetical protein